MKGRLLFFLIFMLFIKNGDASEVTEKEYPFFDGLDTYQIETSSSSDLSQKYFNQGLMLYYGYNYPEAAKSFKAASLLDPDCGINYWGASLALCDCIDFHWDRWHEEAYQACQKAKLASNQGNEKEKGLIKALQSRFNESSDQDPRFLFLQSMKELHEKFPDDPDIAALYANTGVNELNLYQEIQSGDPTGFAWDVIRTLEESMKKYPKHPGLNHFYIHAMEEAGTPEKALNAAKNLDGAVPGSGHLEHMPAHIYFYYGMYHDATRVNQSGINADNAMFKEGGVKNPEFAGFYLHNYYFLFDSLMMEGRGKEAVEASERIVGRIKNEDLPSNTYLRDVYYGIPSLLMARAGMWEKLSQSPEVDKDLYFASGMRAYAKGIAAVRDNNTIAADKNLEILNRAALNYESNQETGPYNPSLAKILQIAILDLGGEIAAKEGDLQKRIENLFEAVAIEDTLYFHMLPWYMYMRHALGHALLQANKPAEAEKIYRQDLEKHPHNGWALYGLIKSLEMQNKDQDAEKYKAQFNQAWQYADLDLTSSRF